MLHEKAKEGSPIGLRDAGYYAIDGLRLEKGYRAWGADISPDDSPLEAGLGFAVDLKNENKNFLGKVCAPFLLCECLRRTRAEMMLLSLSLFLLQEALLKQKKEGLAKRLTTFLIENDDQVYPHGGEPIFRNGTSSFSFLLLLLLLPPPCFSSCLLF